METFVAAVLLALLHLGARALRVLDRVPRSRWLSAAGGISVAYVFVHLLPELEAAQRQIGDALTGPLALVDDHVWIAALLGLTVFYGLERAAVAMPRTLERRHAERPTAAARDGATGRGTAAHPTAHDHPGDHAAASLDANHDDARGGPRDEPPGESQHDGHDTARGAPRGDQDDDARGAPRGDQHDDPRGAPRGDQDDDARGAPRSEHDDHDDPRGAPRGDQDDHPRGAPRSEHDDDDDHDDPRGDARDRPRGEPGGDLRGDPGDELDPSHRRLLFAASVASYAAYNAVIGYLLVTAFATPREAALFALAIGVHFVTNDQALRARFEHNYEGWGRWLLSAAVLAGWGAGTAIDLPSAALQLGIAFLAGGIILNVMKEELPSERQSRFGAFAVGAVGYSALLLVV